MDITLNWEGPFSYQELICSVSNKFKNSDLEKCNKPGVYFHVVNIGKNVCIEYAGRSLSSVVMRQIDHYTNFIGGRYTFPFYHRNSKTLVPDVVKNSEYVDTLFLKDDFLDHVSQCYECAANICLYFAVDFDHSKEKAAIKAAERYLLYHFQPLTTRNGTFSPPEPAFSFLMGGILAGMDTIFKKGNKQVFVSKIEDALCKGRCIGHLP